MIEPEDARAVRDGIADTIAAIDRGDLAATPEQRAYLRGAAEAIDGDRAGRRTSAVADHGRIENSPFLYDRGMTIIPAQPLRARPLALGYTRVSTADQAENGASLDAQEAILRDVAARSGWDVQIIREEGKSAATIAKRPKLVDALARLDTGDADVLLALRLDRVSRSLTDFAITYDRAVRRGWAIVLPASGIDTSAAAGPGARFSAQIQAAAAELERGLISVRTKEGMAQRALDGWAPTAKNPDGRAAGRPRRLDDDLVARLRAERAAGASFAKIADRLNDERVPTAHGGRRWYPATVKAAIEARATA